MNRFSSGHLLSRLSRNWRRRNRSRALERAAGRAIERLERRMMLSATSGDPVPNLGFEDGNLSSWNVAPAPDGGGITVETAVIGLAGRSYTAQEGSHFAMLIPGAADSYTTLSRDLPLAAGQTLSGWAFFDGHDFLPNNDDGQVFIQQGNVSLFSQSIESVGDLGGTGWVPFSYTAPASGSYTLVAQVENVGDDSADSFLGLDLSPLSVPVQNTPTVQVSDPGGTYTGSAFAAIDATVTGTPDDGTIASFGATSLDGSTISFSYFQNTGTDTDPIWAALPGAPTDAGDYQVIAHYTSDNPAYTDADSSPTEFTIAKADPVLSFGPSHATYDGQPHPASGAASGVELPSSADLSSLLSLSYDWTDSAGVDHGIISGAPVRAGTYEAFAAFAGNSDYNAVANFDTSNQVVIDQAALTATVTAQAKPYDGTTPAALASRTLSGVIGNDDVTLVGGTASFDTPDVGGAKTVTVTGLTLAGADAENYTINSTAMTTAAITPAHLTIVANANQKIYGAAASESGTVLGIQNGEPIRAVFSSAGDSATADVGSYAISASLSDGGTGRLARDYVIDSDLANTGALTVAPAAAQVVYAGDSFDTADSTGTATIALQAQVKDNTGGAGNVTRAGVSFQIYFSGNLVTSVPGSAVSLMNATDPTTGTSSAKWVVNLGAATSATYRVVVVISNDYAGSTGAGDLVTVSLASRDQSTGGGYLVSSASGGSFAADAGSRVDFGFSLSDSTGTPGGHINIIFRRTGSDGVLHTYQIKSTSILAYGANSSIGHADSTAVATLTDVTNLAHPVVLATALTLQLSLTDGGSSSAGDALAISLWSGTSLLFSSDWSGLQTLQQTISGGNLQVH